MKPSPPTVRNADPVPVAADCFHTDGFGVIPTAVPAALVSALRQEADKLLARHSDAGQSPQDYWSFTDSTTCQEILYRIHNLEKQDGALHSAALFTSGPLHELAARILGTSVRSMACALIVKVPWHAAAVPWHRDRTNVGPGTVCNLSLFLDDCDAANGCLQFVPASHRLPDDADVQTTRLLGPVTELPIQAGDVAVHDVRTVHASLPNRSARIRRSIVIEFAPTEQEMP